MKLKYTITGLDCPNCAAKLAANMEKLDGIDMVKINFLTEKLVVEVSCDEREAIEKLRAEGKKFSKDISID